MIHRLAIPEGRVHAVVVLRRNHFERKTLVQFRVSVTRFDGRSVLERFRAELALSGGRAESALRKWQKRRSGGRYVQAHRTFAIQPLQRDPFKERMARADQTAN